MNLDIVYQYGFFIDTTPVGDTRSWAEIGNGINDCKKSLNEISQSLQYLSNNGWGSTEVMGAQLKAAFSGFRVRGDAAQDYIFGQGVQFGFGSSRKTNYKMISPDGGELSGSCTLVKIDTTGGKATDGEGISFEVHVNGAPVFNPGLGALAVVSVAGPTVSGTTSIYVNPEKGGSNSYKYQTGMSFLTLPAAGATLTAGWTAWDGSAVITAATGNDIIIAEVVTATNVVVKAGKASVTAHI